MTSRPYNLGAKMLSLIVDDLKKPSAGSSPHHRATTFAGHALVGAAFVAPIGAFGVIPALVLAALYWRIKERRDLRNGGQFWDSVEDTLGVMLGAFYGFAWWPVLTLMCCAIPYARGFRDAKT